MMKGNSHKDTYDDESISSFGDASHSDLTYHSTLFSNAGSISGRSESEASGGGDSGLGSNETRRVYRLKILIAVVLAISVAGTVFMYMYSSREEKESFETTFHDDATKVLESIGNTVDTTLGSMDALVVSLVSYAKNTGQVWPQVVIPDFHVRAEKVRTLARAFWSGIYLYITDEEREAFEVFASYNDQWVDDAIDIQAADPESFYPVLKDWRNYSLAQYIHGNNDYEKEVLRTDEPGPFLSLWQATPMVPVYPPYNWNILSRVDTSTLQAALDTHQAQLTGAYMVADPNDPASLAELEIEADWAKDYLPPGTNPYEPCGDFYYPILTTATDGVDLFRTGHKSSNETIAGILSAAFYWRDMLKDILPPSEVGLVIVFENECAPTFTYQVDGGDANYLGYGDLHDPQYDYMEISSYLHDLNTFSERDSYYTGLPLNNETCSTYIRIFPSRTFEESHVTNQPMIYTVVAILIFGMATFVFCIYDWSVERRQKLVLDSAERTTAIVDSLFPAGIRERLFESEKAAREAHLQQKEVGMQNWRTRSTNVAKVGGNPLDVIEHPTQKAIADVFSSVTVFFGDIASFTSWSSERDPTQVFVLLEALYASFDALAHRAGVFKVETIGDCYVAVCGLPHPRKNHAPAMVRFAAACRDELGKVTSRLESILGPGTKDLELRIGLHSGPVTAGVLRGEKARFQLFGDTVNTAARIESTGQARRIHVSEATAKLLEEAGKGDWLTKRADLVHAKGKGDIQTFWAEPHAKSRGSVTQQNVPRLHGGSLQRLIDWQVIIFRQALEDVCRQRLAKASKESNRMMMRKSSRGGVVPPSSTPDGPRSEIREVIHLPPFEHIDIEHYELDDAVLHQLQMYISDVAHRYGANYFHSFEHACHMVLGTQKLLTRVSSKNMTEEELSNCTYGITSDALAIFGILFSALIHDVDHAGVTNGRLIQEESPIATKYKGDSVMEQNSIDIAWALLLEDRFAELRDCIFATPEECTRFRQMVVNCVIATDIFDKELKEGRATKWAKAFSEEGDGDNTRNRKATVVMEHIIQAADVSHTMQHWNVYRKWNERLFFECKHAFDEGRGGEKDPALGWYKGELWFFDNYCIPLAGKLKKFNVFGGSCDELLAFAVQNRHEWEVKGEAIVEEMVKTYQSLGSPLSLNQQQQQQEESPRPPEEAPFLLVEGESSVTQLEV